MKSLVYISACNLINVKIKFKNDKKINKIIHKYDAKACNIIIKSPVLFNHLYKSNNYKN